MRRFLREPLLHFLLLGAVLFAAYGWMHPGKTQGADTVVVDQERVDLLVARFAQIWQRPPAAAELQSLVDAWVREEILYREGLATGMDADDEVIRRRVVQKMDFLAEGMGAAVPDEAELETWLREHPENYRIAPAFTLRQVYFDPTRHGERLDATIAAARSALADAPAAEVGDPTMLPAAVEHMSAGDLTRLFGEAFVSALDSLPDGRWAGPVQSAYGSHLVHIDALESARQPQLAEVRAAVERDLLAAQLRRANEDFYRTLRARYTVRIEANLDDVRIADASAADGFTSAPEIAK